MSPYFLPKLRLYVWPQTKSCMIPDQELHGPRPRAAWCLTKSCMVPAPSLSSLVQGLDLGYKGLLVGASDCHPKHQLQEPDTQINLSINPACWGRSLQPPGLLKEPDTQINLSYQPSFLEQVTDIPSISFRNLTHKSISQSTQHVGAGHCNPQRC